MVNVQDFFRTNRKADGTKTICPQSIEALVKKNLDGIFKGPNFILCAYFFDGLGVGYDDSRSSPSNNVILNNNRPYRRNSFIEC